MLAQVIMKRMINEFVVIAIGGGAGGHQWTVTKHTVFTNWC